MAPSYGRLARGEQRFDNGPDNVGKGRTDEPPVVAVDSGEIRCHRAHDRLWELS
jgi:hypothetical protein